MWHSKLTGPVFFPDDDGFQEEIAGHQTALQHAPDVVVGAVDAGDVAVAVEYAVANDLPLGVQATGHGMSVGLPGGVLINTRRMDGLRIDPESRTASLAAGVRWGQVIEAAAPHGLAPLNGSGPSIGAVSYTLGGGIGLLSRKYGFAADHVRGIEVVTADGRVRQVSAEQEPDLFWALRGGRANFGIVTAMEVDLVPVRRLYGGSMVFDGALAEDLLHAYREWTRTVPDEMSASMALSYFPDLPFLPEFMRARLLVHVNLAYAGSAEAGRQLLAPLLDFGPMSTDLRDMPYSDCATIHNDGPDPHPYYGSSFMLRDLDDTVVRTMLDLASTGESAILELRPLGGAMARPSAVPNAVGLRASRYSLRFVSPLEFVAPDKAHTAHRDFDDRLGPVAVGRSLNFTYGQDLTPDQVRAGYDAEDYARLAELKAVYDPANVFRWHHNIPPA
jgi:FAD/FMN-containing dehydrogenase